MTAENCAVDNCTTYGVFPDTEGRLYCTDHYPLDDFEHVPEPRQNELQRLYR